MKYISIDIKTTGANPETCQIIEFSAVLDDLSKKWNIKDMPKVCFCIYHNSIHGELDYLISNKNILEKIKNTKSKDRITIEMLPKLFIDWAYANGFSFNEKITLAGNGLGSDAFLFLRKIKSWNFELFNKKILDPSVFWLNPETDKEIPNLDLCLNRIKVKDNISSDTLENACSIVFATRTWYNLPV